MAEEIHLLILLLNVHSVYLLFILAPGPGNYRAPSDFGYYDSKNERLSRLYKSQMFNT